MGLGENGEGISQRTYMHDPWGLTEGGVGVGLSSGEQREKKQGQLY